jgi:serine/threonine-protein kinase
MAADRHLLFGLLALQTGLIQQAQLVAAFHAWTCDKSRSLADHLIALGHLDTARRAPIEALAALHIDAQGGDVEKSLAAVPAGRSTRESLARLADVDIAASIGHLGAASTHADADSDRTASYAVGTATSDGQRFRVLRPHARGGLGAVFVALDGELHREVALKQILEQHADDPVSRQRFLMEAEITGGLEHPGIVPVYGLGAYGDGRPYYAMRFIKGDSLKEAIDRFHSRGALPHDTGERSLALRKLLRRFTDVCNAIEYAHARGVLHRDIKPGNVIVGKHGETLVVDWGLAKAVGKADVDPTTDERPLTPSSAVGSAETLPGSALGTPTYMSPEQAAGEFDRLGPRSDVYSLGATLYCLLTGKTALDGEAGEVLRKVQRGEFAPPRQLEPAIDRALEAICLKAMATKPEDRYPSCRALADDIERWMADEPVTAWREPFARRARRWARRNRAAVASAAAAVLVALAGTGAVLAVQTQANRELKAANNELYIANSKVTEANTNLAAANRRELERFDLAMAAIKLFHGEVSEDLLRKQRQFESLRTKLLRGAADFYGMLLVNLKGQSDPISRAALGKAYDELGTLTGKIGDKSEALSVHLKALAVRRELAAEAAAGPEPGRTEATLNVARSLIAVGLLREETGDAPGALASFEDARALAEGLDAAVRGEPAVQAVLGTSHHRIGSVFQTIGKPALALAQTELARAIRQKLADANPTRNDYQKDLAASHNNIGHLLDETGRPNEAIAAFEKAGAIFQSLADANPSVTDYRRDVATIYSGIGGVLARTDRQTESLAAWEKARAMMQEVSDANPNITQFQRELAVMHNNVAMMLDSTGKPAGALLAAETGRAIRQALADANPKVTMFQRDVAISLLVIGELRQNEGSLAEAAESYRKALAILERIPALPVYDQFNVGDIHAKLAEIATSPGSGLSAAFGQAEADRAVTWLRKAVNGGYRPSPRVWAAPGIKSLHSHPEFQLLRMDMAFPKDPFARRD